MKRKSSGKSDAENENPAHRSETVSSRKLSSSNLTNLPDFDFSKRSHQAAFWMLLNLEIPVKKVWNKGVERTNETVFRQK
jgi:hypothetical protein